MGLSLITRVLVFVLLLAGSAQAGIFIDNGDGTVYDAETGLTWEITDNGSEYLWQWDADSYCWQLKLGGYENWRLPTVVELSNLVDYSRFNPAIDPGSVFKINPYSYWTANSYVNSSWGFWNVDFNSGRVNYSSTGHGFHAICVRSAN